MKSASGTIRARNRRRHARWLGPLLLAATLPAAAIAGSWPPDGKTIAEQGIAGVMPSCASCHGSDFRGEAKRGAPSLRGKTAADLMDDLYDMAENSTNRSKMARIARHLDMSQRAAVTAYIAGLAPGAK